MATNGTTYLKVKIKSLTQEARIIRTEERRARTKELRDGLAAHRRGIVRSEARHAQLAYGYLRGRALKTIEATHRVGHAPSWKRVASLVARYGSAELAEKLASWRV
jgi:hypothetical protein